MTATIRFFTSLLLYLLWIAESKGLDRSLGVLDIDWTIQDHPPKFEREYGWRTIGRGDGVLSRIVFSYDMPRLNTHQMTYKISLWQQDCWTFPVDKSLTWSHTAKDGKLEVKVHVNADTIQTSPYWNIESQETGFVDFCLRVDVIYQRVSRSFHETVRLIRFVSGKCMAFHMFSHRLQLIFVAYAY